MARICWDWSFLRRGACGSSSSSDRCGDGITTKDHVLAVTEHGGHVGTNDCLNGKRDGARTRDLWRDRRRSNQLSASPARRVPLWDAAPRAVETLLGVAVLIRSSESHRRDDRSEEHRKKHRRNRRFANVTDAPSVARCIRDLSRLVHKQRRYMG